ncbi:MAG: transposase [Cytophagaceae bacterium]|nr:transposase [Cytophagaceae bacterium]MDW8456610.1 hypothetical protein [Cytophagaceae bacterium]
MIIASGNMLYSTNRIERLNRNYKLVMVMPGALPNPQATILLLGYVGELRYGSPPFPFMQVCNK